MNVAQDIIKLLAILDAQEVMDLILLGSYIYS